MEGVLYLFLNMRADSHNSPSGDDNNDDDDDAGGDHVFVNLFGTSSKIKKNLFPRTTLQDPKGSVNFRKMFITFF